MATSGSVDFDQQASTIIRDALILCGGLEDDEQPTSEQSEYSLRALNRMAKSWSKKGLKAWCWEEGTLTLVISTASYTLGPTGDLVINRPLEIDNVRKVVSSVETPIRIASRQEYMEQTAKTETGEPVFVYYDPQLTNGVLYVWPAPSAANQIKFSYQQYIEDFDLTTNNPYFPTEWLDALVYNLAYRLCPKYEIGGEQLLNLRSLAAQFLQEAEDGDSEQGSVYLGPEVIY